MRSLNKPRHSKAAVRPATVSTKSHQPSDTIYGSPKAHRISISDAISVSEGARTRKVQLQVREEDQINVLDPLNCVCDDDSVTLADTVKGTVIKIPLDRVKRAQVLSEDGSLRFTAILMGYMGGQYRSKKLSFREVTVEFSACSGQELGQLKRFASRAAVRPISTSDFYGPATAKETSVSDSSPKPLRTYGSVGGRTHYLRNNSRIDFKELFKDEDDSELERLGLGLGPRGAVGTEHVPLDDQVLFEPSLKYKSGKRTLVVTDNDFRCLYNDSWINDSLVDFFVNYYYDEALKKGSLEGKKVEIMNSFFYTQLTSDGKSSEECYSNVKRWFKTNNTLFDNDYVVIPIMAELHWFFVIIRDLNPVLKYLQKETQKNDDVEMEEVTETSERAHEDTSVNSIPPLSPASIPTSSNTEEIEDIGSTSSVEEKQPRVAIFVLDSLKKTHPKMSSYIRHFLMGYAKDKYGVDLPEGMILKRYSHAPQQRNFNDCGLHVIYNLNAFFTHPDLFDAEILTFKRRPRGMRHSKELFDQNKLKVLRKSLREELIELLKKQVERDGGDASEVGTVTMQMLKDSPDKGITKIAADDGDDDDEILIVDEKIIKKVEGTPKKVSKPKSRPKKEEPPAEKPETPTKATSTHPTSESMDTVSESVAKVQRLERSLQKAKDRAKVMASQGQSSSPLQPTKTLKPIMSSPRVRKAGSTVDEEEISFVKRISSDPPESSKRRHIIIEDEVSVLKPLNGNHNRRKVPKDRDTSELCMSEDEDEDGDEGGVSEITVIRSSDDEMPDTPVKLTG